ncbi:hypothetical protein ILUMI_21753 [Ignelater luminosus]|uniref:Chitin-binding type-2 domain-containing protein n=1 Tax=Ignelater luminosus TaxID=2038154 RepID=A0A8K0G3F4_IGNLU|nr:hypothetical protein ILUMI_21753 [Ignelater luminosus]
MLGLKFFLITYIVIAVRHGVNAQRICPQVEHDPSIDILLPHEHDCTKFYKCSHGIPYEMDCPANLHFNSDTNYCDWPTNVVCSKQESSEANEDSSEEENLCPPTGNGQEDDIRLPHKSDCSKFYKCSHGVQYEMDCPHGLHFNPQTKQCDWPYNVNCTTGENEEEKSDSREDNTCPSVEEDPPEDILFPHETDCSKFYKCNLGKKVEMDCPHGLHFNPKTNQCDWPENVNCSSGSNGNNKENENNTENGNNEENGNNKENGNGGEENKCPSVEEDPEEDILFPHETDCSKFYKCSLGKKVEMDCPNGLHFNPKLNLCDWPANVDCSSESNGNNKENENNTENGNNEENGNNKENGNGGEENKCPSVEEDPEEDILFPHETDCSKFYKCSRGHKVEMDCFPGLHFNPKTNQCDWPENVNCSSESNGNNKENENNTENENNEENGNNKENGNGGKENKCPSVVEDPEEDILFPHETDCSKFYKCNLGKKVEMDCFPGLHFNPKTNQCDWPKNVKCTSKPAFKRYRDM